MPQTLTPDIFRISVRPTMNAPGLHSLSSSARTRTSSATASHRRSLVNRPAGLIAPWKKEPEYDSDDQLVPESVKARPVLLLAAGLLRGASKAVADDLASAAGDYLRPQQLALGTPVGLSPLPPTSQQQGSDDAPSSWGLMGTRTSTRTASLLSKRCSMRLTRMASTCSAISCLLPWHATA